MKPMEEFPEKLALFGKTKKELTLKVDIRLNAEYLGQLAELGGGYSTGPKNIGDAILRNAQEIFDRAYEIDNDAEKAYRYVTEYGDLLARVSSESKGVGMTLSTMPDFTNRSIPLDQLVRRKNTTRF